MDSPSLLVNSTQSDPFRLFDSITPTGYSGLATPNSWSLDSSLTPSIFHTSSSLDINPFETSLNNGLASPRKELSRMRSFTLAEEEPPEGETKVLEILPHVYGRKRALSSPALFTPGGMNWGSSYSQSGMGLGLVEGIEFSPKRPKILGDSSNYSGFSFGTSAEGVDQGVLDPEHSNISSAAFTPTPTDSTAASSMDEDPKTFTPPMFNIPLLNPYSASLYPSVFTTAPVAAPLSNLPYRREEDSSSNHSSYQQFMSPRSNPTIPIIESASPFIFQLAKHRENLLTAANGAMAQLQPEISAEDGSIGSITPTIIKIEFDDENVVVRANKVKGPGKRGKGKKNIAATESVGIISKADAEDEAAKRKEFLERNRVAASKSRKKKKERVGGLESAAREMSAKNHIIQQDAFSLKAELSVLRQLIDAHEGCDCEHILGYLAREQTGRGIPTINYLAGRTLHLDYTKFPTMGSNDDVYAGVAGLIVNDREDSEELLEKIDRRTLAGKMRVVADTTTVNQSSVDLISSSDKREGPKIVESEGGRSMSRAVSTRSRKGSSASSSFEAAVMDSPGLVNLELPLPVPRTNDIPKVQVFYQQQQQQQQQQQPPSSRTRPSIASFNGDNTFLFPATSFQNDRNLRSRSTLLSSSESPYLERESSSMRDSYFPTTL